MAIMYLYCDESGKYQKNPIVTFAAVGVTKPRLDDFEKDWESLLRSYEIPELHLSHVFDVTQSVGRNMPTGQSLDERMDALIPFADCINRHLELGFLRAMDVKGYCSLPSEAKALIGGSYDPYYITFTDSLMEIMKHLREEDKVSIFCDDDVQTAWNCFLHY